MGITGAEGHASPAIFRTAAGAAPSTSDAGPAPNGSSMSIVRPGSPVTSRQDPSHVVDRLIGKNSAVDVGMRLRRERIDARPTRDDRRHTRGAQRGSEHRVLLDRREHRGRDCVFRVRGRAQRRRHRRWLDGGASAKVGARYRQHAGRKAIRAEPLQASRQPIDRIVRLRHRGVPRRSPRRDAEVLVSLLRGLQANEADLAVVAEAQAPALVERELRLQRLPTIGEQPAHPLAARLFVSGQRQDHIAAEPGAGSPEHHHSLQLHEGHAEIVAHTAADEESVAFGDLVRRARPRLALGSHDVEVREQQQGLLAGVARKARDEVLPPRRELGHLVRNLLLVQAGSDDGDCASFIPRRVGGVDGDQLGEQRAKVGDRSVVVRATRERQPGDRRHRAHDGAGRQQSAHSSSLTRASGARARVAHPPSRRPPRRSAE